MARVLVVEDEVRISSFIAKGLTAEGHASTVAADGTAVAHPAQARPEPDRVVGGDSDPTALTTREEPS